MKKLVSGFGINDGSKPSYDGEKMLKEYGLWSRMLDRCFSEAAQKIRPNYKGCGVSPNFLNYSYFYEWCHKQIGFGNVDEKGRSWQLDKDLLINGNKIYSEDTCVFVPQEINSFFNTCGRARGKYPVGVYFNKPTSRYIALCAVNGKNKHLGCFLTPQEAFNAYKPFKEALCKELALKWEIEIDPRLFNAMMNWSVKDDDLRPRY